MSVLCWWLNEKPLLDRLREGSHWFFGVLLKHVGSLGSQKQDSARRKKRTLYLRLLTVCYR